MKIFADDTTKTSTSQGKLIQLHDYSPEYKGLRLYLAKSHGQYCIVSLACKNFLLQNILLKASSRLDPQKFCVLFQKFSSNGLSTHE